MDNAPDLPVLPPLASCMKVDFLWDDKGGAWILHDKPLADILKWVDYDPDSGRVTLNTAQGKTQDLGLPVPAAAAKGLKKAEKVTVMLMKDGKIKDLTMVPINISPSLA